MEDYSRLSDDELLRRTAEDREAFGAFYDRHVRAVLIELRSRGLPAEEALDLTAEVFAAALVASRRYRPGEAPACAWLLGIAPNKLAHRHRRAAVETAARRKLGMARLTYSDEALERVDELLDAERSVYANGAAALPPAEREAVVARVIEERDYDEIAVASGRFSPRRRTGKLRWMPAARRCVPAGPPARQRRIRGGHRARPTHLPDARGGRRPSVKPLGKGDWRVLMTPPWTPRAPNARPLRLVVAIDDRDYGNPDDGFQMDEFDAIPREAQVPPALRLTYRDGQMRVARGR